MLTYSVFEFEGEIANSTRPTPPERLLHGPAIIVQVSPPLVVRYTPFVTLPKISPIPAYWLRKFAGSGSKSVASPINLDDQDTPPSIDFRIPLTGTAGGKAAARPAEPRVVLTRRTCGLLGSILMSLKPICEKVKVPRRFQLAPPSVDFNRPAPAYESA